MVRLNYTPQAVRAAQRIGWRDLVLFVAFFGLLFTFVYGYIAAYNLRAQKILVPLLDILQSVPVLGFLSITVTGFMALFPGSLLGLDYASIFAIFTGQAWNMTFSFYQSLRTIPVGSGRRTGKASSGSPR